MGEIEMSGSRLDAAVGSVDSADLVFEDAIIAPVSKVPKRTLNWLWPGRIPLGKITLIAGDSGLGKSFLMIDLVTRVSTGKGWPDQTQPCSPGSVLMFNAENDISDIVRPRLDVAGADCSRIYSVQLMVNTDPETGKTQSQGVSPVFNLSYIEDWLAATPDAKLITIDPIGAFRGSSDPNKRWDLRAIMFSLSELAQRFKVAIVIVAQVPNVTLQGSFRSSTSLIVSAAARAVWSVVPDANDRERRLLLPKRMNLKRETDGLAYRVVDGRIQWEETAVDPMSLEPRPESPRESPFAIRARQQATEWLTEALSVGPRPSKELLSEALEFGHSLNVVRQAFKEIGGRPRKLDFRHGWVWTLPEPGMPTDENVEDT